MKVDQGDDETLIAFLDANIILEGKPLVDLPWAEVETSGTICVLIVPKAMEEIDAKKRDGRLGPYARNFNKQMASSVVDDQPLIIREANPRVEIQMAKCSRIPWDTYDDLDPNDGDSRIVAEAINVRGVTSKRRILISHDIKPLAYARGRNLKVMKASDTWLRAQEPHPKDKEIQRLKQQLGEYQKNEPTLEISININSEDPVIVHQIEPLNANYIYTLKSNILDRNSKTQQYRDHFSIGLSNYDSSYDRRYDDYSTTKVDEFVSTINKKLEIVFNQISFEVLVKNTGNLRADHLVVTVSTNDGWMNQKIVAVRPQGPPAPVPQQMWDRLPKMTTIHDLLRARVGRHEFDSTHPANKNQYMEETCEDFRSGQEYFYRGYIMPSSDPNPLEITVHLTAANLRGAQTKTYTLTKKIIAVSVGELYDIDNLALRRNFRTHQDLDNLIRNSQYDDIEWNEGLEDD